MQMHTQREDVQDSAPEQNVQVQNTNPQNYEDAPNIDELRRRVIELLAAGPEL